MTTFSEDLDPILMDFEGIKKEFNGGENSPPKKSNGKLQEGVRNKFLFKQTIKALNSSIDPNTCLLLMKVINENSFETPLGDSELFKILESARNYAKPKGTEEIQVIPLGDFYKEELFPDPIPIVKGLIHRCEFHLCSATAKTGKTLLELHLAIAVASGEKFLDYFDTTKGNVLVVQTEIGNPQLRGRLLKIAGEYNEEIKDSINFVNYRFKLDTEEGKADLVNIILKFKPSLVILDPFYTLHNANEDSSSEIAPILSDIREIAITYDIAILMIHHQGKSSSGQTGHKHRGSSSFADAPDGSWSLSKLKENEFASLHFEMRNIEAPGPFRCKLNPHNLIWKVVDKLEESESKLRVKDVVEMVEKNEGITSGELTKELKDKFLVSEKTVRSRIKFAFEEEEAIFKHKSGKTVLYFSSDEAVKEHLSIIEGLTAEINKKNTKEQEDE